MERKVCLVLLLIHLVLAMNIPGLKAQLVDDCGGLMEGESGSIQTPRYPLDYPVDKVCSWIIRLQPGEKVVLSFETFSLEDHLFCQYDYVIIRDGSSSKSPMVGKFCGEDRPATITSTSNHLWIDFRSDSSTTAQGFKAVWKTEKIEISSTSTISTTKPSPTPTTAKECGGQMTGESGFFTTPNYPKSYPSNMECEWTIVTSHGYTIELKFEEFNLENSGACLYDFVDVRDGSSEFSSLINRFCASSIIAPIRSSDNSLFIKFKSDSNVSETGFRASWRRVPFGTSTIQASTTQIPSTRAASSTQATTTQATSTRKISTTPTPINACGGVLSGEGGQITSPGYPKEYPLNKQCTWVISAPNGKAVKLQFKEFELEKHFSCRYDYLEVKDSDEQQKPLLGKYCGDAIPSPVQSSGSTMYVKFYSDGLNAYRGFALNWHTIDGPSRPPGPISPECGGRLNQMSGSIKSPRYPENYPENVQCEWVIELPSPYKIRLDFMELQLENSMSCQYDFVLVMDGPPASPAPLGKFCGNSTQEYIESRSNVMTILFKSDSTKTKKGFEAYWFAQRRPMEPSTTSSTTPSKSPSTEIKECGGNLTKPSSDLFSPFYPMPSYEPADCVWVLSVYEGNTIALGFNEFDLLGDKDCTSEYVELRDGGSQSSPLLGRFCKSAPLVVIGKKSKMWLKYHTDGTGRKGFEATWTTMAQALKPMQPNGSKAGDLDNKQPLPYPPRKCGDALGFESGEIKDGQLSVSSVWMGVNTFGPQNARLNNQKWPQGWSADPSDQNPWLNVSLDADYVITGIATQGYGNPVFSEWVESYYILWLDSEAGEVYYQENGKVKAFEGNSDHNTVVRHILNQPFITKQVTIRPKKVKGSTGLRIELYGCKLEDCQEPLGLENRNIKDEQLTASSAWDNDKEQFGAQRARLNLNRWPQGWTAHVEDRSPWLQVNLKNPYIITRIATQGFGGHINQWVKKYRITWENDEGIWYNYSVPRRSRSLAVHWNTKIFNGNKDKKSVVSHKLRSTIKSSAVRFWPLMKRNFVSMRTELYGCMAEPSSSVTKCKTTGREMSGESNPPSKKDCQWHVTSTKEKGTVTLKFTAFDFFKSDPLCNKDFVEVRNGLTKHAPLIGKYCGSKLPSPVQSSGNGLWVRYVVSGEIKTKVGMTYHDGPVNFQPGGVRDKGCGTRHHSNPPSQLDGSVSKQWSGQWPWQVALLLMGQSVQQCAGALIAPQWVLTAAHCFKRFKQPTQWVVRAGEFDLTLNEGSEQNRRAETIYIHSSYLPSSNENDIALVYLERPAVINDKVQVICLPKRGDLQSDSTCVVAGWGSTPNFHHLSAPLRSQSVPVVSREHCNRASSYGGLVKEGMICAGFEQAGRDKCYGDGGGPLMCQNIRGEWFVGGINSWGQGCGLPGKYGVYTFTEKYRDWIDRHIQAN